MATLFNPFFQVVDASGNPIVGAKLYFYTTGTTTPQNTYAQSDLDPGSVNTNPVIADSSGRFGPIYLGTTDYKAILKTAADATIATLDPLLVPSTSIITTEGDLIIGDSNDDAARLPIGAADRVLLSSGTTASWEQLSLATSGVFTGILGKSKGGAGSAVATPIRATSTTFVTSAVHIPFDDTIPQNTEGVEIFSQAFTASTATNRIRVTCTASLACPTTADNACMALFVDSGADAVQSVFFGTNTIPVEATLVWEGTQSAGAHTFKVRVGGNAHDISVNGVSGRIGGGSQTAILIIEELPTT